MTRPLAIAALVFGVFLLHGLNDPTLHHSMLGSVSQMHSETHPGHGMRGESHPMTPAGTACAVLCAAAVLMVIGRPRRIDRLVRLGVTRHPGWRPALVAGPEPPVPRFV